MYRKKPQGWTKHIDFLILDTICLIISYLIGVWLQNSIQVLWNESLYRGMSIMLPLLGVCVGIFLDGYKGILKRGYFVEFYQMAKQAIWVILLASFYLFIIKSGTQYSRGTMIYTGCFYFLTGYIGRILWKQYLKKRNDKESSVAGSLVIVTTYNLVERVTENIKQNNYYGYHIAGIVVVDRDIVGRKIEGIPVVANRDTVVEYVCRDWVDEVFVNIPNTNPICEELIDIFIEMGITVHLRLLHATKLNGENRFIEKIGKYTVLTTAVKTASLRDIVMKRGIDIFGGFIGCLITLGLIVVLGPCIYIKSPGPIFFSQTRIGKNGRKFEVYKFRSMYLDAEKRKADLMAQNKMSDGMMFKVDWDTRIIGSEKGPDKGFGNFIRKYSLDEWPQFFNVLKGDMSLIGTRPPTVDEWEKYEKHHRARLATKPGVTGMWQVSGRSSITDFEEVVKLDMKYIREWSLTLDMKILLKTVWVVLRSEGAQ